MPKCSTTLESNMSLETFRILECMTRYVMEKLEHPASLRTQDKDKPFKL